MTGEWLHGFKTRLTWHNLQFGAVMLHSVYQRDGKSGVFGLGKDAPQAQRYRRDGRVDDGGGLENRYAGDCIVGSNPTPSATSVFLSLLFHLCMGRESALRVTLLRGNAEAVRCGSGVGLPRASAG